jgi:hypothetical protein
MTPESATLDPALKVLEGVEWLHGDLNTDESTIRAHIASSIRRGHPQAKRQGLQADRVVLVGGGPSLHDTERELVDLIWSGAKLVTVNGAYQWCLERNLKPSAQIVLDARASNARFVSPAVPNCQYLLASQCHQETWDAVQGREHVWIWHAIGETAGPTVDLLDAFYAKHWHGVPGGTTVVMRAIALLRMVGYLRFDLFGVDSCWLDGKHHAYIQPENSRDKILTVSAAPTDYPELARMFRVSPWHLKQFEDLLQFIRIAGDSVLLNVHGDGLLAYALRTAATLSVHQIEE